MPSHNVYLYEQLLANNFLFLLLVFRIFLHNFNMATFQIGNGSYKQENAEI